MNTSFLTMLLSVTLVCVDLYAEEGKTDSSKTMRVAAAQAQGRTVNFRLTPADALAAVEENLTQLERIVNRAAESKCDLLVLPEDTPGLLHWVGANEAAAKELLPQAVNRMLDRLGAAAAKHRMYLVVCSDHVEADGGIYNTSFLLGRDGREIGRYHKTCPTWAESGMRQRGSSFPVFETPDVGTVGMLICYDLVMPETARALALQGADVICFPTMGGAAIGDGDIGVQALRVRAVENFVYLIVAQRGDGAMVISPQGTILSQAEGPDGLAIADIDPHAGREGGDSSNWQQDMRARLFRERNPAAFATLVDPKPPVLEKIPLEMSSAEAGQVMARMLTVGEEEFGLAEELTRSGRTQDAIVAFQKLKQEYRDSWIDRASTERLREFQASGKSASQGIATKYPGDENIEQDPRVVFADDFETGDVTEMIARWGDGRADGLVEVSDEVRENSPGNRSLRVRFGHLFTHFEPADKIHVRYYLRFHPEFGYPHHLPFLCADHEPTPWPKGFAGKKPDGNVFFGSALDCWSDWGKLPPPGQWMLYTYWQEMKPDGRGDYWGNHFMEPKQDPIERGRWYCLEMMIKANSAPEKDDGEQKFWVDGKLTGEFHGIRWRSSDELQLNSFWLLHDGETGSTNNHDANHAKRQYDIWFDDVVIATDYIGPVFGIPKSGKKIGVPSRSVLLKNQ